MKTKPLFCHLSFEFWIYFVIWILSFVICNRTSFAQPISSTDLIEKAKEYNNQVVEYQGEVVGDVMERREFAWVNVNDEYNAIGIWGDADLIKGIIKHQGTYNYKGDIILVEGIFHRACPEHGGDLDIHPTKIAKIRDGYPTAHPLNMSKVIAAFLLFIAALGLSSGGRFRRR